jgi:hypothetical protein
MQDKIHPIIARNSMAELENFIKENNSYDVVNLTLESTLYSN